jgi:hypothetical protein
MISMLHFLKRKKRLTDMNDVEQLHVMMVGVAKNVLGLTRPNSAHNPSIILISFCVRSTKHPALLGSIFDNFLMMAGSPKDRTIATAAATHAVATLHFFLCCRRKKSKRLNTNSSRRKA